MVDVHISQLRKEMDLLERYMSDNKTRYPMPPLEFHIADIDDAMRSILLSRADRTNLHLKGMQGDLIVPHASYKEDGETVHVIFHDASLYSFPGLGDEEAYHTAMDIIDHSIQTKIQVFLETYKHKAIENILREISQ